MKRLKIKRDYDYPEDIERIIRVCNANGYSCSEQEAYEMWSSHSDMYAAGWLMLPNDDEDLLRELSRFMDLYVIE